MGKTVASDPSPSLARRIFRVARWTVFGFAVVAIFLVLRPKDPPPVHQDPQAPQRLEAKLMRLQSPSRAPGPQTLRLDEAEVNTWMRSSLSLPAAPAGPPAAAAPAAPLTVEDVRSKVLDVRTHLEGDTLVAHVLFEMYGKEISLELQGHLGVRDGYLRLDPTALWVGSLPVPQSTVKGAVEKLFSDPQYNSTFRVPAGIRDIRIKDGQLVVVTD